MTPLHLTEDVEVMKFLISKGADINARNGNGYTPLRYAEFSGDSDIIQFLVSKGAER